MCDSPAVAVYNRIVNRLGNDELVSRGPSKAGLSGCGDLARRSISKLPRLRPTMSRGLREFLKQDYRDAEKLVSDLKVAKLRYCERRDNSRSSQKKGQERRESV